MICKCCGKTFQVIPSREKTAKCCSLECRKKFRIGQNNPNWKGNKVQFSALHIWISKNKPKPEFCVCCNKEKPHDLANISGKYNRDINDFEWLCRKCHQIKDKTGERHRRKYKGKLALCPSCKIFKSKDKFWKDSNRWDKICIFCFECIKNKKQTKTFK